MTDSPDPETIDAPGDVGSLIGYHGDGRVPPSGGSRPLVRPSVAAVGFLALSGTANAHGDVGDGGAPVAVVVVLGLPIVAGLLGGAVVVRRRRLARRWGHHPPGITLGPLLAVLGATFAAAAGTERLPIAIVGGTAGAVSAAAIARRGIRTGPGCRDHAHLTLGAVCAHRVLEGAALGALYGTGAIVGVVGAAFLAGHTAVETAAVAGLYAPHRARAAGAIVLVQVGYASGVAVGVAIAGAIPTPIRIVALALAGGVLLGTGGIELKRSLAADRDRGRRTGRGSRTDADVE